MVGFTLKGDRIFDILDVGHERSQRWTSRFLVAVAIYRDEEAGKTGFRVREKVRNLVIVMVSLRCLLDK